MKPIDSRVHAEVIQHFLEHGFAPDVTTLAGRCSCSLDKVRDSLDALQRDHGLVLHPGSQRIWVAHPLQPSQPIIGLLLATSRDGGIVSGARWGLLPLSTMM